MYENWGNPSCSYENGKFKPTDSLSIKFDTDLYAVTEKIINRTALYVEDGESGWKLCKFL